MERALGRIELHFTDPQINEILARRKTPEGSYTRHFSSSEEFFLTLDQPVDVPSFPIHHDFRQKTPNGEYMRALRVVIDQLSSYLPDVFSGLKHFFDPGEILRPSFFQLYRIDDQQYLYLVRVNIQYDPARHETVEKGTNEATAAYRTTKIPLEADVVPLESIRTMDGRVDAFVVDQPISQTWIGETGRGYFVQGIWIDRELTKFFTKLVLPPGKRIYPYYPVTCKYRSICYAVTQLDPERRKQWVIRLHQIRKLLYPHVPAIQKSLKHEDFSESMELFQELKERVPDQWYRWYEGLSVRAYLNEREMREFVLED
jgi:hypothetical protein